jgi:hypothetical protein
MSDVDIDLLQQIDALHALSQSADRRWNRVLHHFQTVMFWGALIGLALIGAVLSTSEMPWVWIVQLAIIAMSVIVVALGGRTYLIWPDFKGHHDDYK